MGDDYVEGGTGDDVIAGDAGDDHVVGGAGDDTITGGEGQDVVEFLGSMAGFTVAAAADGTLTVTDTTTMEGTDVVSGIERLRFSDGELAVETGEDGYVTLSDALGANDDVVTIVGPQAVKLRGFGGDDVLTGGDGDDIIGGFAGDDTIDGGAGDDKLFG